MTTQTTQTGLTSVRDFEWDARQQKVIVLTFVVSAVGVALILGLASLLGY